MTGGIRGRDPDQCPVSWCHETADHTGPHRMVLLDTTAMNVTTGHGAILQLWLQGESARTRGVVLVADVCEIGLTRAQCEQLGRVLDGAVRRYQRP